jgi:hypothetical protein
MDIDQASTFLCGSILIGLGAIIIVGVIVAINNIFARYWKPIQWIHTLPGMPGQRFATEDELKHIDKSKDPEIK